MTIPDGGASVPAVANRRRRAADLLRPVGRSRWGMAAWLAAFLGVILAVSAALGQAELGSAVALGFVLTAVPTLPTTRGAALSTIGIRGAAILLGAGAALLLAAHPLAIGLAIIGAASWGATVERVGPTAGLAVVLVGVDAHAEPWSAAALLPCVLGAFAVALAWLCWFGCMETIRVVRKRPRASALISEPEPRRTTGAHIARVAVAVTAAVVVAGLLPSDIVGGHWLITSVLLTVQPSATDTGIRLAQRLLGNTAGALIAAVLLGTHPSLPLVAVVTVVLFTMAMALRPKNYTWWAITGPPVLLVIGEYPQLFPWYEGGVRLVMNLAGASIVLVVVFGPLAMRGFRSHRSGTEFPSEVKSDSVYKIHQGGFG